MMDTDERLEMENDMNRQLGPVKPTIKLSALLMVINQYEQTGDTKQLVEDMDTLGVKVVEMAGRTEVIG